MRSPAKGLAPERVYHHMGSAPLNVDVAEGRLAAVDDRAAARAALPGPLRWTLHLPISPLWLGGAAAAVYGVVAASVQRAGVFGPVLGAATPTQTLGVDVAYALWFAWVPIAAVLFVRGVERDATELAVRWGGEEGVADRLRIDALRVPSRFVRAGVAVGLSLTFGMVAGGFGFEALPTPALVFLVIRELAIEVGVFGTVGWAVGAAVQLSRLTEVHARADLLDPAGFAPLTRNGTRLAGLWLVMTAIGIPALVTPPASVDADFVRQGMLMTVGLSGFAFLALFLPTRGARRLMADAKCLELDRVRREIAEARREREDARLPGLLAWESRVEAVSGWPIDAATLRRLGVFVLLPLGSWIGGALVERPVDAALR